MKRLTLLTLITCILFTACSRTVGHWPPIVVDNDTIYFDSEGGTKVVSIIKNYNSWWINVIKDVDNNKYFYPSDDAFTVVEGNGIKAIVDGKTLIISVSPTSAPSITHHWTIDMECGDAFKSIKVLQL